MNDRAAATPPPQGLPLMHVLLAALAASLLYMPLVSLGDGSALTVVDIAGPWAYTSLFMLGLLCAAALILMVTKAVTWGRALLIDLCVVLCLIPAVVGIVVRWEVPPTGLAGFAYGFWLVVVFLLIRFPLSLWIRGNAARPQPPPR
ncbi:MAG: hypothetical protein JJT90_12715 [Ectothiorhodospiraceae bacterium]|nr:hypothetical protein [Ectothiorhodospiraceae bacterium]